MNPNWCEADAANEEFDAHPSAVSSSCQTLEQILHGKSNPQLTSGPQGGGNDHLNHFCVVLLLDLDWPWSGSQTWRTRFKHELDLDDFQELVKKIHM